MRDQLGNGVAGHKTSGESTERDCSSTSSLENYGDAIMVDDAMQPLSARSSEQQGASIASMQAAVRTLLAGVGEDPDRQGLRDTPKRVAKAWLDIAAGYSQDVDSILGQALFDEAAVSSNSGGMVMVRDIEFASTSAANLLPFHGRCHIAYMPSRGVVLGLSKFARLTGLYARRFQHQQQFTDQILQALTQQLGPAGTAVIVEAKHMAEGPDSATHLTSAAQGLFNVPSSSCTAEFLGLLRLNGVPVSPGQGLPSAHCTVPDQVLSQIVCRALSSLPVFTKAYVSYPAAKLLPQVEKRNVVGRGLRHSAQAVAHVQGLSPLARAPVRTCNLSRLQQPIAAQHQLPKHAKFHQSADCLPSRDSMQSNDQQAMDVSMQDADSPGRPTLQQMENAVMTLLEGVVPHNMLSEVDSGAGEYVHQMMASTSGYDTTLDSVLEEHCSPCQSTAACDATAAWHASEGAQDVHRNALSSARGVEEFHIRFASQCEHHLLPFYGTIHAAYLPKPGAPRLTAAQLSAVVVMYSRRLQIQERLTQQIASAIEAAVGCKGALVVVEGLHMCMVARGVEKHASSTTTVAARGTLAANGAARTQLLLSLCIN